MKIFLAGASGVIGRRLVPLLVDAGHDVAGMTRSTGNVELLRDLGATPVVCDVFAADELRAAVIGHSPELVMHQMTDLPDSASRLGEFGAANARLRREGTRNLLDAAGAAGTGRVIVQSVAWDLPGDAGRAVLDMERQVLDAGGLVLRYGQFYGPGTYHEHDPPPDPRIHVADAATRTVEALDHASGMLTIVDTRDGVPGRA